MASLAAARACLAGIARAEEIMQQHFVGKIALRRIVRIRELHEPRRALPGIAAFADKGMREGFFRESAVLLDCVFNSASARTRTAASGCSEAFLSPSKAHARAMPSVGAFVECNRFQKMKHFGRC